MDGCLHACGQTSCIQRVDIGVVVGLVCLRAVGYMSHVHVSVAQPVICETVSSRALVGVGRA
jgi:hypothetical protein